MGKCLFMRKGETHTKPGSRLPYGYTELVYVQSSGTQYVNTGIIPTTETKVSIEFEWVSPPPDQNTWHSVFGSRTSSSSQDQFNIATDSGNSYAGFASSELTLTQKFNKANVHYTVTLDKTGVIVNGVSGGTYVSGLAVQSSYPMYVFGRNNAGSFGNGISGKVYSMKIYTNDVLVRDFVPCINASGEVGLFDMVNRQFYGNAGTGTFTGSEVA